MNTFRSVTENDKSTFVARSFSGHERNRLFMQHEDGFQDVSLRSGLDSRTDSRGFAKFDFDHDGKLDIVVAGPLNPRMQIFKNELPDDAVGNSVFVDCCGGALDATSQTQWSNRDGVGAVVIVEIQGRKRMFQKSCGEGLACQNSKWIHIGLGDANQIDKLTIEWPSGKRTVHPKIKAGSRVVLREK